LLHINVSTKTVGYMTHHMQLDERAKLARMCRGQADLASTKGVRAVLIELAELFESAEPVNSALAPLETLPKRPE
jgi:hypothetical protein